jgi:hypothetical protein
MWATANFDRIKEPVLLTLPNDPEGVVYALFLEEGASHPYWTITEHKTTSNEVSELIEAQQKARHSNCHLFTTADTERTFMGVMAWVKNGRSPRWLPHALKATVQLQWEQF